MHNEASSENGELLAEGEFEVVPMPPAKFKRVAGIGDLPQSRRRLTERHRDHGARGEGNGFGKDPRVLPGGGTSVSVERRPTDVRIRAAGPTDRAFVLAAAERLADFGLPPWRSMREIIDAEARTLRAFFEKPPAGASLLVAEDASRARLGIAYIETLRDYFSGEEHGHIGILAVAAEAEGRGVAGALVRAAEAWARERSFRKLTLNVFEGNRHARDVYEHLGYVPETLRYAKILEIP